MCPVVVTLSQKSIIMLTQPLKWWLSTGTELVVGSAWCAILWLPAQNTTNTRFTSYHTAKKNKTNRYTTYKSTYFSMSFIYAQRMQISYCLSDRLEYQLAQLVYRHHISLWKQQQLYYNKSGTGSIIFVHGKPAVAYSLSNTSLWQMTWMSEIL